MSRVLVTGANGFVGTALCETLRRSGRDVVAAVRSARQMSIDVPQVAVGEIGATTNWSVALRGVDAIIHTAARVHQLRDSAANAEAYRETNTRGTRQLALAAAAAGVRRLVFLSSIKVNGEGDEDRVYRADDVPHFRDAYGESKACAERELFAIGSERGLEVAVLRVPLVYGPGVRANFLRMLQWIWSGRPLPLGAVRNRRSLLGLSNLCDLLMRSAEHPAAAGRTWLGSDGEDLSTPDLLRRLGGALGRPVRLLNVPPALLRAAGHLVGRSAEISRICGSLQVDSSPVRELLDWRPPLSVDEGLGMTAQWFRSRMV